ncbi:DUF2975 domain-containing protein [Motilimonas cestriensis]|uniref:DUF2975 domain-containing protein n=1 Tax=Motilimonas cestriensis TaxID=2742685 RepID=A0ABS8W945_9GAMM|nr:DUF2975 domain-containing protein [Motilimonas cestriensis]MCE2594319.1 DUF2975 domain-containing protein [Motilimonas cestriensis]
MKHQTIRKIAAILHLITTVGLIMLVIFGVIVFYLAVFPEIPFTVKDINYFGMLIQLDEEIELLAGAGVLLFCALSLALWGVYLDLFRRLFSHIKRGDIFSDNNFKYLKIIGLLFVPFAGLDTFTDYLLAQMILQHANITGAELQYSLAMSLFDHLTDGLLYCGITFLIAGALKMAINYKNDSEGLV